MEKEIDGKRMCKWKKNKEEEELILTFQEWNTIGLDWMIITTRANSHLKKIIIL